MNRSPGVVPKGGLRLRRLLCVGAVGLLVGLRCAAVTEPAQITGTGGPPPPSRALSIHIGIAPGTWQGLNRSDTAAAISAWAKSILQQVDAQLAVEVTLYESSEALATDLMSGAVECVSMLSSQFLALDAGLRAEEVFVSTREGSIAERYLVLVRNDGDVREVTDLPSHRMLLQGTSRTSVALPWLETVLAARSVTVPADWSRTMVRVDRPSKAVLPVFFGQADACMVTASAFEVACELNPQLRQRLRVLATSPDFVPAVFFFRRGHSSLARELLEPAITTLQQSQAGRQVLVLFQADGMVRRPASCLDPTRAVLAEAAGLHSPPTQP